MRRNYLEIANQYAEDVRSGKRIAGKYEKLAVKRYLSDLKRALEDPEFEYVFSEERANHACFFIETCPHVKGSIAKPDRNGNRAKLIMEPWQVFVTVNLFGWINTEGLRRFIFCYIEVAKKNGKSTWIAAIGLYMGFLDGEQGAEIYAAATSKEQANIVFNDAKKMVEYSPSMRTRFGIEYSEYSIYQTGTNSMFKALSQDRGGTKDGFNIHLAIVDELHAHKDASMYDIVADGTASRDQPLVIAITTAGDDTTGVCYRERTIITTVLEGKGQHDQYFGIIFALDKRDDWRDPKNWGKANPNLGVSFGIDSLNAIYNKVSISPKHEAMFRQKRLNEWVGAVDGWLAESAWEACYVDCDETEFKNSVCFGGYDLASQLDLASWGTLYPKLENEKVHWYIFSHNYINERVVDSKDAINGEKRPDDYPVWRDDGHLIVTPGDSTDFDQIERDLKQHHANTPFYELGFDGYHAQQLTTHLIDEGINCVQITQKTVYLSPAMRWIEKLIIEKRLHHNGDPVLTWCVLNVVVREDAKEMIFPRKLSKAKKIDAAIGLINAAARAMHHDNESVFDLVPESDGFDFDDYIANMVVGRRK